MFLLKYFYKKIGVVVWGHVYIILWCGWGIFSKTTVATFLFFKCSYPNPPSRNPHLKFPSKNHHLKIPIHHLSIFISYQNTKSPKHQKKRATKSHSF